MKFSIIVVSLNPGEKLIETVKSVLCQTYQDYEILVKDGLSSDGSLEKLPKDTRIRVVAKKDHSIYDAMNQAVQEAGGEYYLFLNCGDYLYDASVLEKVSKALTQSGASLLYGDMERQDVPGRITPPSAITDFVCYRNVPCHQVCFYHKRFFAKRGYDTQYPVRADYEHFLYCKYQEEAVFYYLPELICRYEGGGFSETKEHRNAASKEHKKITGKYLGKKCLFYKFVMIITLQPLRQKLASSKTFAGLYQKMKRAVQH